MNEVLFSLMSEGDKLTELSRLLGKLRFAQEGRDSGMASEASAEITSLGRHLPENFRLAGLLAAAQDNSRKGSQLAQLYLDRCFPAVGGGRGIGAGPGDGDPVAGGGRVGGPCFCSASLVHEFVEGLVDQLPGNVLADDGAAHFLKHDPSGWRRTGLSCPGTLHSGSGPPTFPTP